MWDDFTRCMTVTPRVFWCVRNLVFYGAVFVRFYCCCCCYFLNLVTSCNFQYCLKSDILRAFQHRVRNNGQPNVFPWLLLLQNKQRWLNDRVTLALKLISRLKIEIVENPSEEEERTKWTCWNDYISSIGGFQASWRGFNSNLSCRRLDDFALTECESETTRNCHSIRVNVVTGYKMKSKKTHTHKKDFHSKLLLLVLLFI